MLRNMDVIRLRASVYFALALLLLFSCSVSFAAEPATSAPDDASPQITLSAQGISIHAVAVQADELFMKLARTAGVGIIVDDTVGRRDGDKFNSRKVTVHLVNKKLTEIIESICTANGLSHSQQGDVFMISEGIPRNPSSYLMSNIDSVTTEYVLSAKAKSLLPAFLQDHVKVNESQNAVVLSAPAEVLEKFRQDIKQFDVPAAQIMIDVIMVEFTRSKGKELGMDFLWSNSGQSMSLSTTKGDLIYKTLGALTQDFSVKLKALVESREASVRANPRIATVSGQAASIFVGRQKYLNQSVSSGYSSKNYIDAGIKLSITPWTGGDGVIIAEIHPEVSVMSALDPVTKLPEKSTRRANTVVSVRDGDTIVIGGLTQSEMQSTKTRIPIIGQIPLIGKLFSGTNQSEVQTELVIFVTPRILSQTGHLDEERSKTLLTPFASELKEGTP